MRAFGERAMRAGHGAIAVALEADGGVVPTRRGEACAPLLRFVAARDADAIEAGHRATRSAPAARRLGIRVQTFFPPA